MRHRLAGRHLGRDTAHRTALYRNLITDLLRYERITTTEAKAKEIRPMAERVITLARRGDVHARRQALKVVYDPKVVKYAFDEIGPRMASRPGGYLRITGLEPRKGDGARMAVIELVDYGNAPATARPERITAAPSAAPRPVITSAPIADGDETEAVVEAATDVESVVADTADVAVESMVEGAAEDAAVEPVEDAAEVIGAEGEPEAKE
jgi:large subunit ribosomal protein L17